MTLISISLFRFWPPIIPSRCPSTSTLLPPLYSSNHSVDTLTFANDKRSGLSDYSQWHKANTKWPQSRVPPSPLLPGVLSVVSTGALNINRSLFVSTDRRQPADKLQTEERNLRWWLWRKLSLPRPLTHV